MLLLKLFNFKGSRVNQYICAVILSIPLLCFGMIQGWLSPMRQTLCSENGPSSKPYTKEQYSWAASSIYITAILTGFPLGWLIDRFGRKIMALITISSLIMYWVIKTISLEPAFLITARVVAGFPCSACYIILPVYIKEISDKDLRSAFGTLIVLVRNLGYLLSFIFADVLSVRGMLYVGMAFPIVVFLLFLLLPETPEFLVKNGKIEEAKDVMAWLRGTSTFDPHLIRDFDVIVYQQKQTSTTTSSWKTILSNPTTRKAFFMTVFIKVSQQFDGYLIVLMFSSYIFQEASKQSDIHLRPNIQIMVVGTVQLIGSMFATFLVEKTGTKILLVVTSFLVGVGMLLLSTFFHVVGTGGSMPGYIPVIALCLTVFADGAGFQPVSYLVISDFFSFQFRGQVSAITNVAAKTANFIQTRGFLVLIHYIGMGWTFLIFAVICWTTCIYSVFQFPETRGKTLEEIYAYISGNKKEINEKSKGRS